MNRKELIKREMESLDSIAKDYFNKVESTLSSIRKEKVKLWLQKKDQYRLLTLRAWEIKYKTTTKEILSILLPFWETFLNKRTRKIKTQGLNVKVTTLIGKKSELILKDQLNIRYPNRENVILWIQQERERIIQDRIKKETKKGDDGVRSISDPSSMYTSSGKVLTLLDFSSPEAFVKYYRKWIRKEQLAREEVELIMKKRAFRNNPFRPEFL
jgi:hypothetical protein